MKLTEIKKELIKRVGIEKDDFKYFGGSFTDYDSFCEFQILKINELSYNEAKMLYNFINFIIYKKPRHIDFYNINDQFIIGGVYFHENGKLTTFSRS